VSREPKASWRVYQLIYTASAVTPVSFSARDSSRNNNLCFQLQAVAIVWHQARSFYQYLVVIQIFRD
jgi:hypothetical protein